MLSQEDINILLDGALAATLDVQEGGYWIVGFERSTGMEYTVAEVRHDAYEKRWIVFVCGNEVEYQLSDVDRWVRKIEMPTV